MTTVNGAADSNSMIGQQVLRLRTERGLSLRALGGEAGVSATLLSQIERGVTQPSLTTIRRLAQVFGEPVTSLLVDPTIPTVWISRPGARPTLTFAHSKLGYERFTPGNGQLEVLQATLAPGECSCEQPWSHASVELAYILSGTLTVEVANSLFPVRAHESITFDSRQPHRYLNESEEPVVYIVCVTPPNP